METINSLQLSIYLSIRYNDIDVFMILLPSIPVDVPFANGNTILQEAIRHKRTTMIFHILNRSKNISKEVDKQLNDFFIEQAQKSSQTINNRSFSSP